ncbi:hypothetical protein K8I28_10380 [bacterium]|nr:hypothetical protein [bacterium]
MNGKIVIFILVLAVVALLIMFSGQKEEVLTKPAAQAPSGMMGMGADTEEHNHNHGTPLPKVSKIHIGVKTSKEGEAAHIDLVPGKMSKLDASEYTLKATEFYTHWNFDNHPINLSMEETNPAAKVEVYKDGEMLYYQWAFKNIPYFNMSGEGHAGAGHPGVTEKLLFALESYEGLSIPDHSEGE